MQLLALLGALALLVCNTAAGLASGLARGLALAAAAVLCAVAKALGGKSSDMFHFIFSLSDRFALLYTLYHAKSKKSTL